MATTRDGKGWVWIRSVVNCRASRIYLRPRFGSFYNDDGNGSVKNFENNVPEDNSPELPPVGKWESLLSPPRNDEDGKAVPVEKDVKHWGPILAFTIPRRCDDDSGKGMAARGCSTLPRKMDRPPNPHAAPDSFLPMDGLLRSRLRGGE